MEKQYTFEIESRPVRVGKGTDSSNFNRGLYRAAVIFVSLLIPAVLWMGTGFLEGYFLEEPIIVPTALALFFGVGLGMKFCQNNWV